MSTPSESLSFLISSRFSRNTVFFQSEFFIVRDKTYLVSSLTPGQMSACLGQKELKISNVFLPKRYSAFSFIYLCIALPLFSSAYGALRPPYLNSPDGSSPGPLGDCITPSRVTLVVTMIFRMLFFGTNI